MKHRTKRMIAAIMSGLTVMSMAACQPTPEREAIVNKEGQSTLVSNNSISDDGTLIKTRVGAPDTVLKSLDCNIEIDANVIIPEISAIPVWSVKMVDLNKRAEEIVDRFYETGTLQNTKRWEFREGKGIFYFYTLEDYETILSNYEARLNSSPPANLKSTYNDEIYYDELKHDIEWLGLEMADAPEASTMKTTPPVAFVDVTNKTKNIDETGSVIYEDGSLTYQKLNLLGTHDGKQYDMGIIMDAWNSGIDIYLHATEPVSWSGGSSLAYEIQAFAATDSSENKCRYTYGEAVALCDEYLKQAGIENMSAGYSRPVTISDDYTTPEKDGYLLYYYRTYGQIGDGNVGSLSDEVLLYETEGGSLRYGGINEFEEFYNVSINRELTFNGWGRKEYEIVLEEYLAELRSDTEISGTEVAELPVLKECICFLVGDDGILSMKYFNPMENVGLVAENVVLLPFDKVCESAYAYLEVIADQNGIADASKKVRISQIELNLARVRNPMEENSYTMLPVWDFRTGVDGDTFVTVNAIDGSIIDRTLGY